MYVDLILRLHADAAAAVNAMLHVNDATHIFAPVTKGNIVVTRLDDGRWVARVVAESGWLAGYSGDTCASEVEALCSLIERARGEVEEATGVAPFHLLEQLEDDARVLAAYRKVMPRIVRAVADAVEDLDHVAEAGDLVPGSER